MEECFILAVFSKKEGGPTLEYKQMLWQSFNGEKSSPLGSYNVMKITCKTTPLIDSNPIYQAIF